MQPFCGPAVSQPPVDLELIFPHTSIKIYEKAHPLRDAWPQTLSQRDRGQLLCLPLFGKLKPDRNQGDISLDDDKPY